MKIVLQLDQIFFSSCVNLQFKASGTTAAVSAAVILDEPNTIAAVACTRCSACLCVTAVKESITSKMNEMPNGGSHFVARQRY